MQKTKNQSKDTSKRAYIVGKYIRNVRDKNVKRILQGGKTGKKKIGRPRKRWTKTIKGDVEELGITN